MEGICIKHGRIKNIVKLGGSFYCGVKDSEMALGICTHHVSPVFEIDRKDRLCDQMAFARWSERDRSAPKGTVVWECTHEFFHELDNIKEHPTVGTCGCDCCKRLNDRLKSEYKTRRKSFRNLPVCDQMPVTYQQCRGCGKEIPWGTTILPDHLPTCYSCWHTNGGFFGEPGIAVPKKITPLRKMPVCDQMPVNANGCCEHRQIHDDMPHWCLCNCCGISTCEPEEVRDNLRRWEERNSENKFDRSLPVCD